MMTAGTSDMRYLTLAEPFEEQAERSPEAVALVGDEGGMTYRQLNESANRLAHLLRDFGVGRGGFVGVCMERSFAMVVALYAIAKAGAAYVPLDPELPSQRIRFVLEDTATPVVLTHEAARARLPKGDWRVVSVDEESDRLARLPVTNLRGEGSPKHPAILLSTSGSTGRPKIVVLTVEQPLAFLIWLRESYPLQTGDTVLLKTPFGFDVSTYEFFWTLYCGATLVVCRPGGQRDPGYLAEVIKKHRATAVVFIPSMLQAFLGESDLDRCRSLRWVFCGGEALTPRLRDAFHARLPAHLVNLYGPTEAGAVTYYHIGRDDRSPTVPIGWPTDGYRLYVLDTELNTLPNGQRGELYIGGDHGLAQGYYGLPGRTAEQFLPDPFGPPGSRMYRTGDLARATPDRGLEFFGRADQHVKVRGQRVDCEEVEAVLAAAPGVREAVVVARESGDGDVSLVGYLEAEPQLNEEALRAWLADRLPAAMIPATFVLVDEWPLSINGKLDRKQLPEPEAHAAEVFIPDASELELAVASLWASVVGRPPKSVHEDFFSAGGDSLRALRLISRLSDLSGMKLALNDLMHARTVRTLAAALEKKSAELQQT
jgi:amino acid adenylation domain-containing protein